MTTGRGVVDQGRGCSCGRRLWVDRTSHSSWSLTPTTSMCLWRQRHLHLLSRPMCRAVSNDRHHNLKILSWK
ncbi:uncharacterized protein DS421_13g408430 [Arachis hypogaea]|nr:uncharacterized protein DS421_13g408430 [Arachis hypogaea]